MFEHFLTDVYVRFCCTAFQLGVRMFILPCVVFISCAQSRLIQQIRYCIWYHVDPFQSAEVLHRFSYVSRRPASIVTLLYQLLWKEPFWPYWDSCLSVRLWQWSFHSSHRHISLPADLLVLAIFTVSLEQISMKEYILITLVSSR